MKNQNWYMYYPDVRCNRSSILIIISLTVIMLFIQIRYIYVFNYAPTVQPLPALIFWASSLHDGCRIDTTTLLQSLNQTVILADHKGRTNPYSAAFSRPKIIILQETDSFAPLLSSYGTHSTPLSENDVRQLFSFYQKNPIMFSVNAFYCSFPMSFCEVYMPFNRTIIWLPAHRFTLGRCSRPEVDRLIQHMQQSAQSNRKPKHFVAAGGRYDQEYIKYYTGLDAILLPTNSFWYAFNVTQFTQMRTEILVGPLQVFNHPFIHNITEAARSRNSNFTFASAKQLYGHYQLQQLANHRAVVLFPYAVLSYGITELYALGIPIFVPSIEFIVKLGIVGDRTLVDLHYCGQQLKFSDLPKQHHKSNHSYSPDDLISSEAISYWLQFADYYQLPHIQTFSSWKNLIEKLQTTNFKKVNQLMYEENVKRRAQLTKDWKSIFAQIDPKPRIIPKDYDTAIQQLWNTTKLQIT